MATVSEDNSEDVRGWGGSMGSDMRGDSFPPETEGGYRGIGLVEVVWKVCAAVVNFRLKRSVILHDVLHGFRAGRGTDIETLEEKFMQQLAGLSHEPLFQVFLEVFKLYDSLYRLRCMEILRGYKMGQNMAHLISHHWDNQQFVPRARFFLGKDFVTGRGVTQVDPASPMIFNIVVGALVREVLVEVCGP